MYSIVKVLSEQMGSFSHADVLMERGTNNESVNLPSEYIEHELIGAGALESMKISIFFHIKDKYFHVNTVRNLQCSIFIRLQGMDGEFRNSIVNIICCFVFYFAITEMLSRFTDFSSPP